MVDDQKPKAISTEDGKDSSKIKQRNKAKTGHAGNPRVIDLLWLERGTTADHVNKWDGSSPSQMLLRALTRINQDDKAELHAWAYDKQNSVFWWLAQE
jgi:hypothetical protein